MNKSLLALALLPLVAVTGIAGFVSSPSKTRPCLKEFTKGVNGGPTHLILAPDGDLYATEELENKIVRFNPKTHAAKEYDVRVQPHDLTSGPAGDDRIWFVSATGKPTGQYLGALTPSSGRVEFFPGITRGATPHMLRWNRDGRLYITEQEAGALAIFDPSTGDIEEGTFGLPSGNFIHNIAVLPNGDLWAVLQEGDKLARFSFEKQRFDKFVDIPIKGSGPRDITFVPQRNAVYATLFAANKIVEYDLDTNELTVHDTHLDSISYPTAISTAVADRVHAKLTFVRPDAKGEALWVATLSGGELLRFDLDTHDAKRVGCGVTVPAGPLGIATDSEGTLWIAEPFPGRIARVDE